MGCGGKDSDERITEALIKKVFEMKDKPLEDIPSLTPDAVDVKNEPEEELVNKLSAVVCKVGDKVKDDKEIKDAIDGLAQDLEQGVIKDANKMFMAVFKDGITWVKIVSSLYVVGRVVGRMVDLCQSGMKIMDWILDFFKKYLLGWIREQGGWIRCLVSVMSSHREDLHHRGDLVIMFFTGMALGIFTSWRLTS